MFDSQAVQTLNLTDLSFYAIEMQTYPKSKVPAPVLGIGFTIKVQWQLQGQGFVGVGKTNAQSGGDERILGEAIVFFKTQRGQHTQHKLRMPDVGVQIGACEIEVSSLVDIAYGQDAVVGGEFWALGEGRSAK